MSILEFFGFKKKEFNIDEIRKEFKPKNSKNIKKNTNTKQKFIKKDIINIKIPKNISEIPEQDLKNILNDKLNIYNNVIYSYKKINDQDKLEWHTWEIFMIIEGIQRNIRIKKHNLYEIIDSSIIREYSNIKNRDEKLSKTFYSHFFSPGYTSKTKESYRRERVWSSKDVRFLLLFIFYKED